jgi:hypothetical protein
MARKLAAQRPMATEPQKAASEEHERDTADHGIAHIAIGARDHQVPSRVPGRQGPASHPGKETHAPSEEGKATDEHRGANEYSNPGRGGVGRGRAGGVPEQGPRDDDDHEKGQYRNREQVPQKHGRMSHGSVHRRILR